MIPLSSMFQIMFTLFMVSCIPLSLSEIRNTYIADDSRPMILLERFGFAAGGQVAVSVKDVSLKSKNEKAQLDTSYMAFFLAREFSLEKIVNSSFYDKDFCFLSSPQVQDVKILFKLNNLTADSSYDGTAVAIDYPDEYNLAFGNCRTDFAVSMYVHTEMYNLQYGIRNFLPAGLTELPQLFFIFFLVYTCFLGLWVGICVKQRPTVQKIHLIMGALLLVKAFKMICASEEEMYVSKTGTPHGWDVAFYIFGFLKGVMLFTVIILIGTGWSILKPHLQEREKNVLIVVIPLQVLENIAHVVVSESGPATKDWMTWTQFLLLIDLICCCAVFFPVIWSIRSLKEASKTDGKAARNLHKLILFKQLYALLITYLYFTRLLVPTIGAVIDYRYEWIAYCLGEIVSLAFYASLFYYFQPIENNPYLVVDEEEEMEAGQLLEEDDTFEL